MHRNQPAGVRLELGAGRAVTRSGFVGFVSLSSGFVGFGSDLGYLYLALILLPVARIVSSSEAPALRQEIAALGFTKRVFGFDAKSLTDPSAIEQLCRRYSRSPEDADEDLLRSALLAFEN